MKTDEEKLLKALLRADHAAARLESLEARRAAHLKAAADYAGHVAKLRAEIEKRARARMYALLDRANAGEASAHVDINRLTED